jgi:hypothetical protein
LFRLLPPAAALTQISIGALASQAVYVAAKLGISDLMVDGPKSVDQLASSTNVDAPSLYRLLRALSSLGVYAEEENRTFKLTPMSELLRSDLPDSLRDVVIFMGEEWHWNVWAKMLHSVQTGKPAWSEVHGQEVFPYFEANREASDIFDKAMTSFSSLAVKAVVDAYDFSEIGTLVDIAGGHGSLLTAILAANPSMRGVLFDQPHVIDGAREALAGDNTGERVEFAPGDFFVSVPSGSDAYIMKHIIHDWDDERAIAILKCIKQAMNPGARVLLIEAVIEPGNAQDFGKLLDIEMLISPGGKERTANEYEELFLKSGLRLKQIVRTQSPYSVIEAVAG